MQIEGFVGMVSVTDKNYLLANTSETSLPDHSGFELPRTKRPWFFKPVVTIVLACCLLLSLAYNATLSLKAISNPSDPYMCRSPYSECS